jgi:mitotic-spindle organizing protein 1
MNVLQEMSTLLNTGLDRHSLSLCVELLEQGANPQALAAVVKDLLRHPNPPNTSQDTVTPSSS